MRTKKHPLVYQLQLCMYLIMNERTGSGILIKKLLFSNFLPGIRN